MVKTGRSLLASVTGRTNPRENFLKSGLRHKKAKYNLELNKSVSTRGGVDSFQYFGLLIFSYVFLQIPLPVFLYT